MIYAVTIYAPSGIAVQTFTHADLTRVKHWRDEAVANQKWHKENASIISLIYVW